MNKEVMPSIQALDMLAKKNKVKAKVILFFCLGWGVLWLPINHEKVTVAPSWPHSTLSCVAQKRKRNWNCLTRGNCHHTQTCPSGVWSEHLTLTNRGTKLCSHQGESSTLQGHFPRRFGLGLLDLTNKNRGYPVRFEFQINSG